MLYDNLNIYYTSDENDNINIFPCAHNWTVENLRKADYDILKNADIATLEKIVQWLTSPADIAEGLNLKIDL